MEVVIKVEGMMCPHCKAMVEKVCKAVPGTQEAEVDLMAKTVTVTGYSYSGNWAILRYNVGLEEENGDTINDAV